MRLRKSDVLGMSEFSNACSLHQGIVWASNFLVLGVDAFHRKESGYPFRDFASRLDRAYKLEIQIIAYLIQDLQIRIQIIAWVREGSYGQFYPNTT